MPYPSLLNARPGVPGSFGLEVDSRHPAFQGHFPENPILSGLIQVDWALRLGYDTFGALGTFRRLDQVKFKSPIRPAEPVELCLSWNPTEQRLAFCYTGREGVKSQGIAVFTPAP